MYWGISSLSTGFISLIMPESCSMEKVSSPVIPYLTCLLIPVKQWQKNHQLASNHNVVKLFFCIKLALFVTQSFPLLYLKSALCPLYSMLCPLTQVAVFCSDPEQQGVDCGWLQQTKLLGEVHKLRSVVIDVWQLDVDVYITGQAAPVHSTDHHMVMGLGLPVQLYLRGQDS